MHHRMASHRGDGDVYSYQWPEKHFFHRGTHDKCTKNNGDRWKLHNKRIRLSLPFAYHHTHTHIHIHITINTVIISYQTNNNNI
jgi:hypothetical protein